MECVGRGCIYWPSAGGNLVAAHRINQYQHLLMDVWTTYFMIIIFRDSTAPSARNR